MKDMIKNLLVALAILNCFAAGQSHNVAAKERSTIAAGQSTNVPVNPARVILWQLDGCNTDHATATYSFYQNQTDTSPLWQETQTGADQDVQNYVGNASGGVPTDIFSNGTAGWLEQVCSGEPQGVRVPLTAAPYAISAMDSASLGGRPASDYALADQVDTGAVKGAVSSEASRAQQAEADLSQQIANETDARQTAVSAVQMNDVATASQLAALNASIVALQARITALEASIASLSTVVANPAVASRLTQQPLSAPIVTGADTTTGPAVTQDGTNLDEPSFSRSLRLARVVQQN